MRWNVEIAAFSAQNAIGAEGSVIDGDLAGYDALHEGDGNRRQVVAVFVEFVEIAVFAVEYEDVAIAFVDRDGELGAEFSGRNR